MFLALERNRMVVSAPSLGRCSFWLLVVFVLCSETFKEGRVSSPLLIVIW